MSYCEKTSVLEHRQAGPGYRFLVVKAPRLAADLVPGQFVHVRVPALEASALRRPFSVFDAEEDKVSILYKVVGRGTEALAKVAVGDELDVMGPMGTGFPLNSPGVPLLVGGGYGVAPLHFLAKRLVAKGDRPRPILFLGGRAKEDLLALDEFAAIKVEARLATNDGSVGEKGFVTGPLDDALAKFKAKGEAFSLYTCGPDGLLKAVADRALAAGMPGWISMDRHMICGVGACFACIQRIKDSTGREFNARCCVDGPVFDARILVF